jgi:hypothetical protein
MKIQIENLKAQMQGRDLTIYQKGDALVEFNKLLDYVEELEQLTIPAVVGRSEQLLAFAQYMCEHQNNLDGKTAKDYLQDFLSQ